MTPPNSSNHRKSLPRHVSEDSQRLILQRQTPVFEKFSGPTCVIRSFGMDYDKPRPDGAQNQLPHQMLLYIAFSRGLYNQKTSTSEFSFFTGARNC